jgi:hypothetical protein
MMMMMIPTLPGVVVVVVVVVLDRNALAHTQFFALIYEVGIFLPGD